MMKRCRHLRDLRLLVEWQVSHPALYLFSNRSFAAHVVTDAELAIGEEGKETEGDGEENKMQVGSDG